MKESTQEELRQRAKDRVQEWKDTIPGYREKILEQIIEQEMYMQALRYNSDLDYHQRCKEAEERKAPISECFCSAIKKIFNA